MTMREASKNYTAYLARNIPEPAAVPGASTTLKQVTDLVSRTRRRRPHSPGWAGS